MSIIINIKMFKTLTLYLCDIIDIMIHTSMNTMSHSSTYIMSYNSTFNIALKYTNRLSFKRILNVSGIYMCSYL